MIPEAQNYNMTQEITTSQQGVTVNYYIIHQKKTFLDVEELSQEIPYAKKSIYNMISNVFYCGYLKQHMVYLWVTIDQ